MESFPSIFVTSSFCSLVNPVLSKTSATSSQAKIQRFRGFSCIALYAVRFVQPLSLSRIFRFCNSSVSMTKTFSSSVSSVRSVQFSRYVGEKSTPPLKSAIYTDAPFFMLCIRRSFNRTLLPEPVEPPNRM